MCGITGVININLQTLNKVENHVYKDMITAMKHRGPDEEGEMLKENLWFGFSRLSIIDLAHGQQPIENESGSIVCICNGEIFNYKELRKDLISKGHVFRTNCDVEVLVHLYEDKGIEMLNLLNGQFSFALYDHKKQLFFLARDHVGICPLFYSINDGHLIFASEIKAILKYPGISRQVNLEGLDQIFCLPGLCSPTTMFRDIHALRPGHYLKIQKGKITVTEYWDLIYPTEIPDNKPESFYEDGLHDLLVKSVAYRLQADVPVGMYISGGLDSAIIAGLSRSQNDKIRHPSFGIIFDQKNFDEREYQHLVASLNNNVHDEINFDIKDISGKLSDMIFCAETPLKETYNTCGLALSERVKQNGIKVVLTGEGADELFGGYVGYKLDKQRTHLHNDLTDMEQMFEAEVRDLIWGDESFQYEKNLYPYEEIRRSVYSKEVDRQFNIFNCLNGNLVDKSKLKNRSKLQQRSYLDFKLRLSDHLLADHGDRISYANSVEARYPFLDINVIEFAKQIPDRLKLNDFNEKYILRKTFSKYIPGPIQTREKFGFVAPGTRYLLQQNDEFINDLLSYDRIKRQGYFDPDAVESLKKIYRQADFSLSETFEVDILMIVLTFSLFVDLFKMPSHS